MVIRKYLITNCAFINAKKFTFVVVIFIIVYLSYYTFFEKLTTKGLLNSNFSKIKFKNLELTNENGITLRTTHSSVSSSFRLLLGRFTSSSNAFPIFKLSEDRLELTYSSHIKLTIFSKQLTFDSSSITPIQSIPPSLNSQPSYSSLIPPPTPSPTTKSTTSSILPLTLPHTTFTNTSHTPSTTSPANQSTLLPSTTDCYQIHWESLEGANHFKDHIFIGDSYWYGGALMADSYWPMNGRSHQSMAFVTGDSFNDYYGSIQERFWMSSSGVGVYVDYHTPLFVDINHQLPNHLTFESKFLFPYLNSFHRPLKLNYTICFALTPKQMFLTAARHFWTIPSSTPHRKLFENPSWSTWASFKWSISEAVVKQYARNITNMGFHANHMVIDDGWMSHYGDFSFSPSSFPNPKELIAFLKHNNFTVSLWLHPFSSFHSSSFWKRDKDGYSFWAQSAFRWLPALMVWWNGLGAALDLTNPLSIQWFVQELRAMASKYSIDSFKFDAGESSWLPYFKSFKHPLNNPNDYTQAFTNIAHLSDSGSHLHEIRSSVSMQHYPILIRLIDKHSDWSAHNGLRSIIPQALTVGLIGYPFILPDMVGGNGYYGIFIHMTLKPDRELYIRWTQVSALMPAMQFSIGPWLYDSQVQEIAVEMVRLHTFFSSYILSLAHQATLSGEPIVRPLWWNESEAYHIPKRESGMDGGEDGKEKGGRMKEGWMSGEEERLKVVGELYKCEDEFLLGDEVLVAPVVRAGSLKRWVFFPSGVWVRGRQEDGGDGGRKYGDFMGKKDGFNGRNESKRKIEEVLVEKFEGGVYRGSYEGGVVYEGYNWYEVEVAIEELAYFVKVAEAGWWT